MGGGLIGLFLLTWVSLWSQVAPAATIWSFAGPVTGDPITSTTFPDSDALDLTNTDFTVSACVLRTRNNGTYSSAILTKRGSDNGWALLLDGNNGGTIRDGGVKFVTAHDKIGSNVGSNQSLSLSTTYHIAVVYKAGQTQIFINGIGDGTKAIAPPKASKAVLRVGADVDYATGNEGYRWRGTLSNLQIDNTALSQAQIQTLCASCGGVSCGETPLCPCPDPNNPFAACPSTCPTTGATYTSGVIHIPQLSISGSNQTCEVYLLQQPSSFNTCQV